LSSASSAVVTWSRPWASDRKASLRSAVHLIGALELLAGPHQRGLFAVQEDLAAEAAAHVGRDHAHLVLGDAQHEGAHQQPLDVRVLVG
jgi:hypothetical protein